MTNVAFDGGSDRARTDDLFRVKEALSLLSYVPMPDYYTTFFRNCKYYFRLRLLPAKNLSKNSILSRFS